MSELKIAFKEWAVICRALVEGRQMMLLRKGGIAEPGGILRIEHSRFWLFPTYLHQSEQGLVEEYHQLLRQINAEQPAAGTVRLTHVAEVVRVGQCTSLDQALALEGRHGWSRASVESRFHYRQPGLFVIVVRLYEANPSLDLAMTPYLEGCKTWVELERAASVGIARPLMIEDDFMARYRPLERLLLDLGVF